MNPTARPPIIARLTALVDYLRTPRTPRLDARETAATLDRLRAAVAELRGLGDLVTAWAIRRADMPELPAQATAACEADLLRFLGIPSERGTTPADIARAAFAVLDDTRLCHRCGEPDAAHIPGVLCHPVFSRRTDRVTVRLDLGTGPDAGAVAGDAYNRAHRDAELLAIARDLRAGLFICADHAARLGERIESLVRDAGPDPLPSVAHRDLPRAFDRWMDEYTNAPHRFESTRQAAVRHVAERIDGDAPSYGVEATATLLAYVDRVTAEGEPESGMAVERANSGAGYEA